MFGELKLGSSAEVLQNWEALKSKEREGREERASMLKGLPKSLPALAYARSLRERLAPLGIPMEVGLLDSEGISDLERQLFALALEASAAGINPEEVLRHANEQFRTAFQRLEALAWDTGSSLQELPVEQRTALWHRAWHEAGE